MTVEVQHLCWCLERAVGWRAAVSAPPLDWNRWLALAAEHKVAAFLFSRMRSDPPWPDAVHRALGARYAASAYMNGLRMREQVALLASLGATATYIGLKGIALAHTLYREAAEREMADLDLLVPAAQDAEALWEALRECGFVPKRDLSGHHHFPPMAHPSGRLTVEIHTNLMTPPLPGEVIQRIFERAENLTLPGGVRLPILARPHRLFHHCIHALRDPFESPLLRNLFEIAWQAREMSPGDWREFEEINIMASRPDLAWRAVALARHFFEFAHPPFARPRASTIEWWSRWRLGTVEEQLGPFARFARHVGIKHFDRVPSGRWTADGADIARVLLVSLCNAARTRIRGLAAPWRINAIARAPLIAQSFGQSIALLRPTNGQIYVLRGPAAEAWRLSESESRIGSISERLRVAGHERAAIREAIRSLVAQELWLGASTQKSTGDARPPTL